MMDTFKIVATMEKRGVYFTLVPHKWERNKLLYWPQHLSPRAREKLRSDPTSEPDNLLWIKYKCIVKLSNIKDFKEGIILEKQFTECSDTEAEELLLGNNYISNTSNESNAIDRNYMFETTAEINVIEPPTNKVVEVSTNNIVEPINEQTKMNETIDFNSNLNSENNTLIYSLEPLGDTNSRDVEDLKNEFSTFREEIRKDIQEIKDDLKTCFCKIATYLDRIDKKIDNNSPAHACSRGTSETGNLEETEELFEFPVCNDEQVHIIEQKIHSSDKYKSRLIEYLSKIGGKSGQEDGTKIGYKLVDHVFDAKFLTSYSWTGISRGQKHEKKCFQNFEGLLNVFFKVIFLADNRHTIQKNNNLFKDCVLKHAKKRSLRKRSLIQTVENIIETPSVTTDSIENVVEEILEDTNKEMNV